MYVRRPVALPELRKNVAKHILANGNKMFTHIYSVTSDSNVVRKSVNAIKVDGAWTGEDAILATADYLDQNVSVFVSSAQISPITYFPSCNSSPTLLVKVAFYEHEHYAAVTDFSFDYLN